MTMPQTRHYEMKDSGVEWIGRMPIGWKIVPAKFFMKVQAGYPFDSERFDNSQGIPLIRIRDITSGHTETFYNGDYPEEYVVHNNDLLVGMDGDFNVRWWQGGEAVLNQRCCRILARNGLLLRYFYFLLPFYLKQVNELAYSTTVKHLANGDIGNADICLPPEDEQTAIAAYLDEKCATIDAIIAEAKASIEEYKSWKASVIFETVTKGLNPNAEMKDSGVEWIGEIPRAWSAKRIKTLALSSRSLFIDGDWINSPDISEAGIRYFTTGNIGQGYFKEQGNGYITTETFNRLNCTMVHAGDLIISRLNEPIGRACIIPEHYKDCIVAVDNVILRPDDGYNKKYLMYCMSSDRYAEYTALLARGTTMHRISRTQLGNIFLPIPPSSEQAFIVSYLDEKCAAIDSVIAEKEALISDLETYKRSLIFEVVTGKRRVC